MKVSWKKALVTGGAGFIGSHLVEALLAQGCAVSVLDDMSTGCLENLDPVRKRISLHVGSICDRQILDRAISGCDAVFHQAAMVSVPQTVEMPVESAMVNEIGTLSVLEAARRHSVRRVVLASSCAVYGDDPALPKREDLLPCPLSPYAVQKLAAEEYARVYHRLFGLETVCLRYFNVYGPRQNPSSPYSGVISIFMSRTIAAKPPVIYGDGRQSRDFVYVGDVVSANLLAASDGAPGGKIYNVGTARSVSVTELWALVCRVSGFSAEPQYLPPRPGDILASEAGIELVAKELGFRPEVDLEKGLAITYAWYKR